MLAQCGRLWWYAIVVGMVLLTQNPASAYIIIFKDGYTIRGKIGQTSTVIVDRASGKAFSVPLDSTPYFLETYARRILFAPAQVHDVIKEKPSPIPAWTNLGLAAQSPLGTSMHTQWMYHKIGDWDKRWERSLWFSTTQRQRRVILKDVQRVNFLTPEWMRVLSRGYRWTLYYRTKELGPETVRRLLEIHYAKARHKLPNDTEKNIKIAKFLSLAGWPKLARENFVLLKAGADKKYQDEIAQQLLVLDKILATDFVIDLQHAANSGRHAQAEKMIADFYGQKLNKIVAAKYRNVVFDLKLDYEKRGDLVDKAKSHLKTLPKLLPIASQPFFIKTADDIIKELNLDTVSRLQTFLRLAKVHELARQQKRKLSMPTKNVLAFAMTGWLLGDAAAKGTVADAVKMWTARRFVRKYQITNNETHRTNMRKTLLAADKKSYTIDLDLLARVINTLPPPEPHDKINTDVQLINNRYLVKLPPGYHHHRAHPVLIVLHNAGLSARSALDKWSELAAKHGYILVAPAWTNQLVYGWSQQEHDVVLQCLRDLRRRFQIDNDRVFLTGSEWGGTAAWDIAMAHPDQFAGVLPMATWPDLYISLYWSNAMYLPVYVVDGQRHGLNDEMHKSLFKRWIRSRFPVLFVQYKGRGREWFGAELPDMFDWMNRKKRYFPTKQVGSGTGMRSEMVFRSLRAGDNRFYWLSTKSIHPLLLRGPRGLNPNQRTAGMRAKILGRNEIRVYTFGLKQVSIWLAPGMVDFSKPVTIMHNTGKLRPRILRPNLTVMMEDFYERGDRQRLFVQRVDLNPR